MNIRVKDILADSETLLKKSPTPRLDVEVLLCFLLDVPRLKLISDPERELSPSECDSFNYMLSRRANGEPVAYITGIREFWGLSFEVSPAVLIPRPETEILVEELVKEASMRGGPLAVLDLGCGSGAIAVSAACELKARDVECSVTATDNSPEALEIASKNAKRHGVNVEFVLSNWFSHLTGRRFDLIASNPPYIAQEDKNISPELAFEPQQALYSGKSGLDAVRVILSQLSDHLHPRGVFLCETGCEQKPALLELYSKLELGSAFSPPLFFKDYSAHERVLKLVLKRPV